MLTWGGEKNTLRREQEVAHGKGKLQMPSYRARRKPGTACAEVTRRSSESEDHQKDVGGHGLMKPVEAFTICLSDYGSNNF